jgi:hypothetical protein
VEEKKSKINTGSSNFIVVDGRYCQLGREKKRERERETEIFQITFGSFHLRLYCC